MELFYLNINSIKKEDELLVKEILPNRYKKAKGYKFHDGYLRCIGAGLMFIKCLGVKNESDILYDENNKFYIKNGEQFSISHSGDYVVFVKGDKPLGIDIIKISLEDRKSFKKVFTKKEIKWMEENKITRFYVVWAQKESVRKAIGTGVKIDSNSYDILPFEEGKPIVVNNMTLLNKTIFFENYVISVSSTSEIDCFSLINIKTLNN